MGERTLVQEIVYIRGTHRYAFRSGEWATLIGVEMLYPVTREVEKKTILRPVYRVRFPDGKEDEWAVASTDFGYEFKTESYDV